MADILKEDMEEVLENLVALIDHDDEVSLETLSRRASIPVDDLRKYVKILKAEGYLEPGTEIKPTDEGLKLGKKMVRKHRLLETFLHDVLGLKKDNVHEEACKLEHALSDDAEKALCRFLEHPEQCPDDHKPIPACSEDGPDCENCGLKKGSLVKLTELSGGCKAKVRLIRGGKAAVRRLRDMGIIPDMEISIRRKSPMGGPIELEVCGTKLALGRGIAEKVFVEVC